MLMNVMVIMSIRTIKSTNVMTLNAVYLENRAIKLSYVVTYLQIMTLSHLFAVET